MLGKLFVLAMMFDEEFQEEYSDFLDEATESAADNLTIGAPELIGNIVLNRWFNDEDIHNEYPNLVNDIIKASIPEDAIIEVINND